MKDLLGFYNVIDNNRRFKDIILLESVICQCSNNTWKCEQWFMKDLLGFFHVIHDNKCFNDIILLEFVICQCPNNT